MAPFDQDSDVARRCATPPMMRLSEPQRWVDFTDYRRHAVESTVEYAVGDELDTFCGTRATVGLRQVHHQARWKTCERCHDVALQRLAEHSPAERPGTGPGAR